MESKKDFISALKVQGGVQQPPSINPSVLKNPVVRRRNRYSADEFVDGILSGNRTILSQAITLVESSLPVHNDTAQLIIEKCLPYSSKSIRIGITGVPGAGKSTFIEAFGLHITGQGRKLAVLTIDPSSTQTRGSILGDKTRMEQLSVNNNAFIRPSPSAGTLGGVARKTRETIILCEASGFDTIIVETVGVGQSETTVHSMVDFFLLLMLAGSGDELQGIKRGIMEMADMVAITKADGQNKLIAEGARVSFQNAIHFLPPKPSAWLPQVRTCSAVANTGIREIWSLIQDYVSFAGLTGYFEEFRRQQSVLSMHNTIFESIKDSFYEQSDIKKISTQIEKQLLEGTITPYKAAQVLLDIYYKK